MKRSVISLVLIFTLLLSVFPLHAFAAENDSIITFDDGSYIKVELIESSARATNSKSGQKVYNYYDADSNLDWKAVLTANFTYTGSTSTCTSASCSVTIYDSDWYQVSKSTSRSGNTATTQLTMGHKVLGVTISKPSYTLTLSCDANGNLS